jgi:uncharacterized protein (TIGR03083 family)
MTSASTRRATRLGPATYLDRIRLESARFLEVLSDCDPGARVPACPDWDAADLVWHLAGVQWFWTQAMRERPAGPPDEDRRPVRADTHAALLAQYADLSSGLVDALTGLDPDEPAWSWADHVTDGQTVGFTLRRQAHEALIHRLDAEQTAGAVTPLDPALAADGVAELLEVMYGGAAPAWGRIEPGAHVVRIDLTDVATSLWARPCTFLGTHPESGKTYDGPHVLVVDDPGTEPSAVVSATAGDLDAAWWKRRGTEGIEVTGDHAAYDELMAALDPPLD